MSRQKHARGSRLREAGDARFKDALCLARAAGGRAGREPERWLGARYLAGIALECYLKWAVCETHDVAYLDEIDRELVGGQGHDLSRILDLTGLRAAVADEFEEDWKLLQTWSVNERYEPRTTDKQTLRDAEVFVSSCEKLIAWMKKSVVRL